MINMERIVYADYLRVIGIIGVIGVHLSADYITRYPLFTGMWFQGAAMESITRSGVLLFIMVSGLLLLDRPQSIDTVPRRLKRVLTPFLFWLFIYYIKYVFFEHTITVNNAYDFIMQFVNCVLNPDILSIEFWYIAMIIGFYLMLPILYKWIKNTNEKEIEYFLVIWLIVLLLNFFKTQFLLLDYVNLFAGHLGYFILGYYLSKKENSKYFNSRKFGVLLFVLGTIIIFLSIAIPSYMSQSINLSYLSTGNLTPGSCLKAIGMFLILKNTNFKTAFGKNTEKVNTFIRKFAELTFGIYLIHTLLPIRLVYSIELSPFINVPLCILLIIIMASIILIVMNKIPLLQKFTGMKN